MEPPYSTRQFTASVLSAGAIEGGRWTLDVGDVAVADLRRRGRCRPPAGATVARPGPEDQRFTRTGTSTGIAR
jgi:hypothetical protein